MKSENIVCVHERLEVYYPKNIGPLELRQLFLLWKMRASYSRTTEFLAKKPFLTSKFQKHLNWMSVCSTKHGPKPVAFCWQFVAECSANPETISWFLVLHMFNLNPSRRETSFQHIYPTFLSWSVSSMSPFSIGSSRLLDFGAGYIYKLGSVFSQRIKINALPDPKEQHDFLSVSLSKLLYFTQLFSSIGEVMQAETIVKHNLGKVALSSPSWYIHPKIRETTILDCFLGRPP